MNSRHLPAGDDAPTMGSTAPHPTPDLMAHFVVKTARPAEMIAWYQTVFGAKVVHEDAHIAFLAWDEESHRLALIKVPRILRHVFPLAKIRRKFYGFDHIAYTYRSLKDQLAAYEALKQAGITPVWAINHGPTTSLYHENPEGIRLEFQVENFATGQATAEFFGSRDFADNPIGVTIDPDYLLEQLHAGADEEELLAQSAGVGPGAKWRANKRTINWRTL